MKELSYKQVGDYQIPLLKMPKRKKYKQGKYSRMRLNYLKNHKRGLLTELMLDCRLEEHLGEIEMIAQKRVKQIIQQLAQNNGINEELKEKNQMEWVGQMNAIKNQAEEIVIQELIYN